MRVVAGFVVAVVLLAAIAGMWFVPSGRSTSHRESGLSAAASQPRADINGTERAEKLDAEGITNPNLVPASESGLRDTDLVIGVVAFGEARAYLKRALAYYPERHIVNDKFGDVSVTVTHCDVTSCTRVLTNGKEGDSVNVRCGGWSDKKGMSLLVDELEYSQLSKDVPLQDVSHVVTTWKEWRTLHPKSMVYLGAVFIN